MGLTGLLKRVRQMDHEMRIVVLGLDGCGKTSILNILAKGAPGDDPPTKTFDIKDIEKDQNHLRFFDVSGSKSSRISWRVFLDSIDGIIWVIDSYDNTRIEESKSEFENILNVDRSGNVPILVLMNKQDIKGCISSSEINSVFQFHRFAQRNIIIMQSSTSDPQSINDAIDTLIHEISDKNNA